MIVDMWSGSDTTQERGIEMSGQKPRTATEIALETVLAEGARRALLSFAETFSPLYVELEHGLVRSVLNMMRETASNPTEIARLINSEPTT